MTYRNRRRLRLLVVLVALYAVIGFFLLPLVVKRQLEQRLSAELERPVRVGSVRVNPFTLSAEVAQVDVRTPDDHATMGGWDRLYVNFDAVASLFGDWVFDDIDLNGFHTAIEVQPDGSLNFSDLIQKFSQPTVDAAPPSRLDRPVRIKRLRIADARVDFTDRSQPEEFHSVIGPIDFTLLGFRTVGKEGAPYRFEATTDAGEKFSWNGTLTAAPLASKGEWRVENLKLANYAPYLGRRFNARLTAGDLTIGGEYDASLAPDHRQFLVRNAAASIRNLRVLPPTGGDPLIELNSMEASGIAGDVLAPRLAIDAVHLTGGRLAVSRKANGTIDLVAALGAPAGSSGGGGNASAKSARPADVTVREITLRDFAATLRDGSGPRPVELKLTRMTAGLKNFSLAAGAAIPLDVTFGIDPQGSVHASGVLMMEPLQADVDLELAWLPLPPLSPYLEQSLNARVQKGTGSLKGHVKIASAGEGPLNVTFTGAGRVEDFSLTGPDGRDEVAGFSQFALDDVRIATAPKLSVSVREVKLDSPFAHAVRDDSGKLNLAELATAAVPSPGAAAAAAPAALFTPPPGAVRPAPATTGPASAEAGPADREIAVAHLAIAGGNFTFTDRTMEPDVELGLAQTSVQVRDLSLGRDGQGSLELHALLNGKSPIDARGRIGLRDEKLFADLTVECAPADLNPLGPYVAKYAGYELEKGSVKLDARAAIAAEKIDAQDTLTLDDFSLGQPTNSPDAVKAPVRLAVALLKDSNGQIVLHIPVQGNLGDPSFSFGAAAGHVFTNVLAKAAKSPFTLLGSMFGGGGEELAQQEFMPGKTELTGESRQRLATVQRALANRPALRLEIEGGYDGKADSPALKRVKLDGMVWQRFWDDRRKARPDAPPPEPRDLSATERETALRGLFAEKFPNEAGASAPPVDTVQQPELRPEPPAVEPEPTPPATEEPAEPPKKHRGLLGRAWDTVTLKPVRRKIGHTIARITGHDEPEKKEAKPPPPKPAPPKPAPQKIAPPPEPAAPSPELPVDEIERRLLASVQVTPDDLRGLAEARANRVRDQLIAEGKIAPERITIAKAVAANGARVTLHLQ